MTTIFSDRPQQEVLNQEVLNFEQEIKKFEQEINETTKILNDRTIRTSKAAQKTLECKITEFKNSYDAFIGQSWYQLIVQTKLTPVSKRLEQAMRNLSQKIFELEELKQKHIKVTPLLWVEPERKKQPVLPPLQKNHEPITIPPIVVPKTEDLLRNTSSPSLNNQTPPDLEQPSVQRQTSGKSVNSLAETYSNYFS